MPVRATRLFLRGPDSREGRPVFNRIVSLKDPWKKLQARESRSTKTNRCVRSALVQLADQRFRQIAENRAPGASAFAE